jgi:hypothetical protein
MRESFMHALHLSAAEIKHEIKQKTRRWTAALRIVLMSAWMVAAPWVAVITARA